eukprot:105430-Prymnesium_polylepis.1
MKRLDERARRRAASDLGARGRDPSTAARRLLSGMFGTPPVLERSACRSGGSAMACGRTEGAET